MPTSLIISIIAGATTLIGTKLAIKLGYKKKLLAKPNERSAHKKPTPAFGGVIFVTVFYITILLIWKYYFKHEPVFIKIILLSVPITICGLLDDIIGLSAKIRILIQICVASLSYLLGFKIIMIQLPYLTLNVNMFSSILTIFFIVGMTNIFNFIDGLDGYLAGITIIALSGLSLCFYMNQLMPITIICMILIGCLSGFIYWNLPNAKIFMGDVGSCFLGFFIALMSIYCDMHYSLSLIIPLLMFMTIIFDTSVTLLIRILKKKKVWEAHNEHEYQKLNQILNSQQKVIAIAYIQTGLFVVLANVYIFCSKEYRISILIMCIILLSIKYWWVYQKHSQLEK